MTAAVRRRLRYAAVAEELAGMTECSPSYIAGYMEAVELLLVDGQVKNALVAVRALRGKLAGMKC